MDVITGAAADTDEVPGMLYMGCADTEEVAGMVYIGCASMFF